MAAKKKAAAEPVPKAKRGGAREGAGRPSKRTEAIERLVYRALKCGLSVETAANLAGVGRRTIYDWMGADPEFRATLDKARAEGIHAVANKLAQAAQKGEPWAVMYWLARRVPEFREPREQPIDVDASQVTTAADAQQLIVQVLRKGVGEGMSPAAIGDLAKAISALADSDKLASMQKQSEELAELVARKTA